MEFRELHMLHDHTKLDVSTVITILILKGYRRVCIGIKAPQHERYQTSFSSILKTNDSDMRVNYLYNRLPGLLLF